MSAPESTPTQSLPETDDENAPGWEVVEDLPPSAKLVAKILDYESPLTQSQLSDETLLPGRTVRYALNRLEDVGAVDSRFSFVDARKRVYELAIE
jgi:DNA-binding MarR family transcriptional regulator